MARSSSYLKDVISTLLLVAFAALTLSACSSSGSGETDVIVDDTVPVNDPVLGTAVDIDGRQQLNFILAEDTVLEGLFQLGEEASVGAVTIVSLPSHGVLTLLSDAQAFRYTPEANYFGTDDFGFVSRSGRSVYVNLDISSVADAPVLSADFPDIVDQGRTFSLNLVATDADGDELTFSSGELPTWMELDTVTGLLSGFPGQDDIGVVDGLTFSVTDATGRSDEISGITLEVVDVNDAPFMNLTQAPETLLARESVSFRTFPQDPDRDSIEVSVEPDPYVSALVDGDLITLTAADVESVTQVVLAIRARDEFGAVSRELLELTLYPRTVSGKGTTIMGHQTGRGVHLVILGDGYAADEQLSFRDDVDTVIGQLRSDEGIARHLGAFNIHMIETISNDSGSDDRYLDDDRDTAYDSGYNCRSIPRLICANNLKILENAIQEYPPVDQLILLVNDRRYGGSGNSGGSIAITSAYSPEIALHEMGHSLADLADEYVDPLIVESSGLPDFIEGSYPNVSAISEPSLVPWAHWIEADQPLQQSFSDEGVGIFEGGLYRSEGIYRATFNSRMRDFDETFGPVNSEQWVLRLYTLTDGIRDFEPRVNRLSLAVGESGQFSVTPIFGLDNQSVIWTLNGEDVDPGTRPDQLDLLLPSGNHTLVVRVEDITGVIRLSPPHAGIFSWTWNILVQ